MSELLDVASIKQDPSTQPRLNMIMAVVEEYEDAMKGGVKFPPNRRF
jgi:hypothetical protein